MKQHEKRLKRIKENEKLKNGTNEQLTVHKLKTICFLLFFGPDSQSNLWFCNVFVWESGWRRWQRLFDQKRTLCAIYKFKFRTGLENILSKKKLIFGFGDEQKSGCENRKCGHMCRWVGGMMTNVHVTFCPSRCTYSKKCAIFCAAPDGAAALRINHAGDTFWSASASWACLHD